MANSLDLKELAEFQEFKDRVKVNLVHIAGQVVGESMSTPSSSIRQTYGISILRNPSSFIDNFCLSLSVQANIAQSITIDKTDPENPILTYSGAQSPTSEFDAMDIEIQSVLSAIYNDLAGVKTI